MSSEISFFNTLNRKIEKFSPLTPQKVKMYTCGPTVYDFAHIGNFRSYVFEDLLRRFLLYKGYEVVQVMNITDIDDKIIRASQAEGILLTEFTKRYITSFYEDIKSLNIQPVEYYPRATAHISEMVEIIKKLVEDNFAYKGEDNSYYYSIEKFKDYGQLSHLQMDELIAGARVKVDEYEKDKASDFALWKSWDEDDGEVFWETELGKGRPGWHIECSAMSMKYLGEQFDIHTGGVDNIFPHHENEIAQSEAYSGKKFVNYWLHCEHLLVDERKMSKSLGNFYTLRDLVDRDFSPYALRYLYISTHYRSKLNFTLQSLKAAQNTVDGILDFLERLTLLPGDISSSEKINELLVKTLADFTEKLSDDLNTPQALSCLFNLITETNRHIDNNSIGTADGEKIRALFFHVDEVLGLNLSAGRGAGDISPEDKKLVEERDEARKSRDFKRADEIRDILQQKGILLKDTASGTVWKKI